MKQKIVFVEDDEDIRNVVEIMLTRAGYEVMLYADESFVSQIETAVPPELYLFDRQVGVLDMLEICYLLKTLPNTKHIEQ